MFNCVVRRRFLSSTSGSALGETKLEELGETIRGELRDARLPGLRGIIFDEPIEEMLIEGRGVRFWGVEVAVGGNGSSSNCR